MFIACGFYTLRAPKERNVLVVGQLHAAPTERDNLKLPGAINILLLRSKESPKLKATFYAKPIGEALPQKLFSFTPGFSPVPDTSIS
jgi:hypothetical protein